jgi:hypothetical protein
MRAAAIALLVAGCAGSVQGTDIAPDPGDGAGSGSGPGASPCSLSVTVDPVAPIAGPSTTIYVSDHTFQAPGVLTHVWRVQFDGTDVATTAGGDDSQISFAAPNPGVYDVTLDVTGQGACPTLVRSINVGAPGALAQVFRMRVLPPRDMAAPPLERLVQINGGATVDLGITATDMGVMSSPHVIGPEGGVAAYLRISPDASPDAFVEAFSDSGGNAVARLASGLHAVLIVPSAAGLAPRQVDHWAGDVLHVDAGQPITGVVRDPAGDVLAGARVTLTIGGVPSTLATTAADGSFTLGASRLTGAVTVDVTPPAASGLPRLSATSSSLVVTTPLQIRYASNVTRKDLVGTQVRRQGALLANTRVTVVGVLGAVGTVVAGGSATATGEIRIATRTDAAGALPSVLVPSGVLSAVVAVADGDLAVAALDTSDTVPASLDAPAMQPIATAVFDAHGTRLSGAVLDLVPAGALALAAAPPLHLVADGAGAISTALATGGHYDLRFHDPAGRGAPLVVADRTTATIATTFHLPAALEVRGTLLYGGTQPLANGAVQFLCSDCTGIERTRPIAEVAADEAGRFVLAVPDPGTR